MKQWSLSTDREPGAWIEAFPIGNGSMGGMVFGGVKKDRLALNLDTLWSGSGLRKDNSDTFRGDSAAEEESRRRAAWEAIYKAQAEKRYGEAERLIQKHILGGWTESYLPAGDLFVELSLPGDAGANAVCGAAAEDYSLCLDLNEAVCRNSFTAGGIRFAREVFAALGPEEERRGIVYCLRSAQGECFDARLSLTSLLRAELSGDMEGRSLMLTGRAPSYVAPDYYDCEEPIRYDGESMDFRLGLRAELSGGSCRIEDGAMLLHGVSGFALYIAGETAFAGADAQHALPRLSRDDAWKKRLDERLAACVDLGAGRLKEEHIRRYRSYFDRVELELEGQEQIAFMYHYARYLLISSSMRGTQAANLQGIWNERLRAPWSSNYTVNINTEMNYWIAESSALGELHEPLFDLIGVTAGTGTETAARLYGCRGWVSHHNIDIWGHSTPVGELGQDEHPCSYSMWNMSSGWLCRHLWEHYQYSGDTAFLRDRAYPLMRGAVLFYLDWLTEENGVLVTPVSTSPENMFLAEDGREYSVSSGSAMDMSIIRELFQSYLDAREALAETESGSPQAAEAERQSGGESEEALAKRVREALGRLAPLRIGKYGQLQEWDEDYEEADVHHRHVSHLYGLYPGDLIRDETLRDGCRRALTRRGDEGTGWCMAWRACLWAKLGDGDRALSLLERQLRPTRAEKISAVGGGIYPNGFCAHPPFQIDGNFGFAAAVTQMLLYSDTETLSILPALPGAWKCGRLRGFRAKGGLRVDFDFCGGRVSYLAVHSERERSLRLICGGKEKKAALKQGINVLIGNAPAGAL